MAEKKPVQQAVPTEAETDAQVKSLQKMYVNTLAQ